MSNPFQYRRYKNEANARTAIKNSGLHLMTVDYNRVSPRVVEPVVVCANYEDQMEVTSRGFHAIIDKKRAVKEEAE